MDAVPIPLRLLRDLKCRHCGNFLSCGPVHATPDSGMLCGRCDAFAKPTFRNRIYEQMAERFRFPCRNWEAHCPETGGWNGLVEHEEDCPYDGGWCGWRCVNPALFFVANRTLPDDEFNLRLKCGDVKGCGICGRWLSCEPVHVTSEGDNVCHRCCYSNGRPADAVRNLSYEKLATVFDFPCIFRTKGCDANLPFGRCSWEHEVRCHYRTRRTMKGDDVKAKDRGAVATSNLAPRQILPTPTPTTTEIDLGYFDDEEFAPVVKEYVQHNPQNGVQRNESLTIGNADLIAELRAKYAKLKRNKI